MQIHNQNCPNSSGIQSEQALASRNSLLQIATHIVNPVLWTLHTLFLLFTNVYPLQGTKPWAQLILTQSMFLIFGFRALTNSTASLLLAIYALRAIKQNSASDPKWYVVYCHYWIHCLLHSCFQAWSISRPSVISRLIETIWWTITYAIPSPSKFNQA